MAAKLFFCLTLSIVCLSVNCFSNIQQKRIQLTYEQGAIKTSLLSRFKRQSGGYGGYKDYMQAAAVPSSVVIMPSGVPTAYRGPGSSYVPSSPYGIQSSYGGYGAQGTSYGASRVPTVVVNMPDDNYITPVINSPYAVPSRRL